MPLGADYLEVLAIADPDEAAASPLGAIVAERIEQDDGLIGWAVAVPDVAAVAARLGTEVIDVARGGQTGRLTGLHRGAGGAVPAVLHRARAERRAERHHVDRGRGRARPARGSGWAAPSDLPVHVLAGPPAVLAVGVGDLVVR